MKFRIFKRIHHLIGEAHGLMPKRIKLFIKLALKPVRRFLQGLLRLTYPKYHPAFNQWNNYEYDPLMLEIQKGLLPFDPQKEILLLVSHEDSRTGAPIILLNLAKRFEKKYNIVILLLYRGSSESIREYFLESSTHLVGPIGAYRDHHLAHIIIEKLIKSFTFKFAVVNSVESYGVLPDLARHNIPSVTLIHELAAGTTPRTLFEDVILWSTISIFSTRWTKENFCDLYPRLKNNRSRIIPQGSCIVPSGIGKASYDPEEDKHLLKIIRPESSVADELVILGMGLVSLRKGVDLFIECAAALLRSNCIKHFRFVWIGSGYNREDMSYSIYLREQINRSGLEPYVYILDEISNVGVAYRAADIFLLTSRLDPLPNVGIDAMKYKLPLLCFDQASGLAITLIENGLQDECVVPYLDTAGMADKIIAFAQSDTLKQRVSEQLNQIAIHCFDFEKYSTEIENSGLESVELCAQERRDVLTISNAGVARLDYYLPFSTKIDMDEALRCYVRSWASRCGERKLFPGFHPGIYMEQCSSYQAGGDPLAQYLLAGKPQGPWKSVVITPSDAILPIPDEVRIALHIHIYYPELFPDILIRLNKNRVKPDLYISVPSDLVLNQVRAMLPNSYTGNIGEIKTVPNKGRDIGPFLTAFKEVFLNNYDLVGHIHTKKTIHAQDEAVGRKWFEFLLENLIGGKNNMADLILGLLASDPSIGLVFPDDSHLNGWSRNRSFADSLAMQMGLPRLPENIWFPMGNMFWASTKAIRPLIRLGLKWEDYPEEPIPIDGTILHALERITPAVVNHQGLRFIVTNIEGINR